MNKRKCDDDDDETVSKLSKKSNCASPDFQCLIQIYTNNIQKLPLKKSAYFLGKTNISFLSRTTFISAVVVAKVKYKCYF